MTGDGRPFVLLQECQTTGGYPRIGTVIPADLPKLVQTPPGIKISFQMVTLTEALSPGTYNYDLQEVDSSSNITTLLIGKVKVVRDITRTTS